MGTMIIEMWRMVAIYWLLSLLANDQLYQETITNDMKYLRGEVCAKYASRDEKVWINMSQLWNNMTVNVGIT